MGQAFKDARLPEMYNLSIQCSALVPSRGEVYHGTASVPDHDMKTYTRRGRKWLHEIMMICIFNNYLKLFKRLSQGWKPDGASNKIHFLIFFIC